MCAVYDGQFLEGNKVGVGVVMQPISMQSAPTLSHAASSKNVSQSRAPSEAGSCRSLLIEERVEPPGAEFKSPPSPSFPGAGAGAGALDDSSQPSSTGSRGKPPVDQWKANRIKGMMSQMSSFRYVGICRLPNVLSLVFTRICALARHNTGDCHYGNCGYTSHFSTGKYALGHVPEYTSLRNGRADSWNQFCRCIDGVLLHTSVEETYEQRCKQKSGSQHSLVGGHESQDTSCAREGAEEMAKGEELKRASCGVSGEVGGDWGKGPVPTAIKKVGSREWEDSVTDEDEDGEDEDEGGGQEEQEKNKAQGSAAAPQPCCEN